MEKHAAVYYFLDYLIGISGLRTLKDGPVFVSTADLGGVLLFNFKTSISRVHLRTCYVSVSEIKLSDE